MTPAPVLHDDDDDDAAGLGSESRRPARGHVSVPLSPVTQFRPKMAALLRQSPRGPEPASRSPACDPDPQWGAGEGETKTPVYQSQEVPENIRNPGLVPPPRSLCHYRVNIISGCWKTFPLKNYAFLREKNLCHRISFSN